MSTTPSNAVFKVLNQLANLGQQPKQAGDYWMARCPAHDDHRPSLKIDTGDDGRALLKCYAGCKAESIAASLDLRMSDLFNDSTSGGQSRPPKAQQTTQRAQPQTATEKRQQNPFRTVEDAITTLGRHAGGEFEAEYPYRDEQGTERLRVLRFKTADGKTFRPIHPVEGGWQTGDPAYPLPLYNVDNLPQSGVIYVVEGEKAADSGWAIGLHCTTSAHGASGAKNTDWTPLVGREVVILPDNDETGSSYARDVARRLLELGKTTRVRIVDLPDLPDKGDLFDFTEGRKSESADATKAAIEAEAAKRRCLTKADFVKSVCSTTLADVEREEIDWLWPGRFAFGKLSILAGHPGLGKSYMTCDMAARVSRGDTWPGFPDIEHKPGNVLMIANEDGIADTMRPRCEAAGADLSRVRIVEGVRRDTTGGMMPFSLEADLERLEELIVADGNIKLLIIDPVSGYMGDINSHNTADVRRVLDPLIKLAERHHITVVGVHHLNKSAGSEAITRLSGSGAFTAAARMVSIIFRDQVIDSRREVLPAKNNLADDRTGFAYRMVPSDIDGIMQLDWEPEPVNATAEDRMREEFSGEDSSDAVKFLLQLFDDVDEIKSADVYTQGEAEGYSKKQLRTASKKLDIDPIKSSYGGGWVWRLPKAVAT